MKVTKIMKGKRLLPLVALAAMSLVACGGGKKSSDQPSQPSSTQPASESKSSVAPSSQKPSSASESKSSAPAPHVHNFQEVTAESGEDYKVMKCTADETKYLAKAVAAAEADSTGHPDGSESADKFGKGQFFNFKFTLKKNYKVNFQIGLKLSSDSHSDRKFQTYAEGASSSDSFESNSANDGTQRYWLVINGDTEHRVEVTNTKTYGENGMNTTDFTEVELVSEIELEAGVNMIQFCSHTQTGYRLYVGGEVRLGVLAESEPTAPAEKKLEYKGVALKEIDGKAVLSYEHEFEGYKEAELKALTPYFDAQENPYAVTGGWNGNWLRYTNVSADSPLKKDPKADLDVPASVVVDGNKVYFNFEVDALPAYKYTLHLDVLNSTVAALATDQYADFKPGVEINQKIEVGEKAFTIECVPSAAENGGDGAHFWGALGLIIESNHKHNFAVDVAHEKGEGEVAEVIKQCAADGVYQISWDVQDAAKVTGGSGIGSDGKLASGGSVEYKVWAPENMKARLYLDTTYNSSNLFDRAKGASDNECNSVFFDHKSTEYGWKMHLSINGREVLPEKQSMEIDGQKIPMDQLMYTDFVETADGKQAELPWLEFNLAQGQNTIKIARDKGYSLSMKNLILRGEKLDAMPQGITLQTQELVLDEGKPTLQILGYYDGLDKAAVEAMPFSADLQKNQNAGGSGWDKLAFGEGKVKVEVNDNGTFIAKFDLSDFAKDVYLLHFEMNKESNPGDVKLGYAIEGQSVKANGLQYTLKVDPTDVSGAVSWGCPQITIADEPIPEGTVMLTRGAAEAVKFEAEDAATPSGWKNSGWTDGAQFVGTVAEETEKGYTITASGDKFTTASTGAVSNAKPFEITVHADADGVLSMKIACARGNRNTKTSKDMNLSHAYEYKLDGETGKFEFASPDETKILAKDANNYEWVVIEWKAEVTKGTHVIQGFVTSTAQNDAAGLPCLDYFLFDLQEKVVLKAAPIGSFAGAAVSAADDSNIFANIALGDQKAYVELGSDKVTTDYTYDNKTGLVTIALGGNYGNLTATFDEEAKALKNVGVDGAAAAALKNNGQIELAMASHFYSMDGDAAALNEVFGRRVRPAGKGWNAALEDVALSDKAVSGETALVRDGSTTDDAIGVTLRADFAEAQQVKSLGFWVYNPSDKDVNLRLWTFRSKNWQDWDELGTLTAKAGQWTYIRIGIPSGKQNIYNFNITDFTKSGVNLIIDDIALI